MHVFSCTIGFAPSPQTFQGSTGWFLGSPPPLPPYGSDRSENGKRRSGVSLAFQQALICLSEAKKSNNMKNPLNPRFCPTLLQSSAKFGIENFGFMGDLPKRCHVWDNVTCLTIFINLIPDYSLKMENTFFFTSTQIPINLD